MSFPKHRSLPESRSVARPADYVQAAPARNVDPWDDEPGEGPGLSVALEYWRLLLRHKGLLVLAAAVGALIGLLVSLPETPVYRATTTLELQELNQSFLGFDSVTPTESAGVSWDMVTQIELLKSNSLVTKVVDDLELTAADLSGGNDRLAAWRRALGLPEPTPEEKLKQAVDMARSSISVSARGASRILNVSTESTDPALAAKFANALAEGYIRNNVESRWSATQYTEEWLDRQLDDLRIKLEASEDRLQSYAQEAGLVFTGEQENIADEQLGRLQEQLSSARADRIAKQSQYELVESNPAAALELIENPYREQLAGLRQELASMKSTFTDDYPEVRSLQARIDELEAASLRASGDVLNSLRAGYEAALRRERLLQEDFQQQAGLVSDLSRRKIQYDILRREVETSRSLYDNILQKGKEARLSAAMQASPIRIVDPAQPPGAPFKPNHSRSAALGLLLGALGGVALIVLRDRLDRTIKGPGDAEYYLNTVELGLIPAVQAEKKLRGSAGRRLKVRVKRPSEAKPGSRVLISRSDADEEIAVAERRPERDQLFDLNDRTSPVAESFRATLTSLLFASDHSTSPRMIVVTSAFPEEGKSTVASNLAAALAAIKRSVLIVDGDMRRPKQHKIFDAANDFGLTDLLLEATPLQLNGHGDHRAVLSTAVPGVHIIPSGRNSAAPSNILHSPRAEELFAWARSTYDYVLIDTPPMVQLPDARLFARYADGVVMVLRAGSTNRDAAAAAVEQLRKDDTTLLGVVLNGWNPKNSNSGTYGAGAYYQYYDSYFKEADGD